ncbi:MAG TPA: hypothetical protein VFN96_06085 [Gemmatimonadales bacterium]|nr:hypothetical protein [Gemmatimonadales bacterium]
MRPILCLLALATATSLPAQQGGTGGSPEGYGAPVQDGFRRVRTATEGFAVLDSATRAGYGTPDRCYSDGHHGAMGFHHVNRALVDGKVEVERPEILLFERLGDGSYRLNGVEYIIPFRIWPRDSVPPAIMGLELKREEQLQLWYLHMWVWNENPAGLFADWHPEVKCPGA